MSYLWTGSLNGIKLQLWGTWLFYAVLVDLGDTVADEISLPFDHIPDISHCYETCAIALEILTNDEESSRSQEFMFGES